MWANWKIVVAGLLLVLGPVGLRVLTWNSHPKPAGPAAADVEAGRELFVHEWKKDDPLCEGGDGLGPVFNANSCVACHHKAGLGGAGGLEHNVTAFVRRPDFRTDTPLQGVIHASATEERYLETLNLLSPELPKTSRPALPVLRQNAPSSFHCSLPGQGQAQVSQRNTPALFGCNLIDSIPDRVVIAEERRQRLRWGMVGPKSEDAPVGRALRLKDGRVGKFGWKAQSASLSDFVQAACANELGLSNPGQAQPRPLGFLSYTPKKAGYDLTQKQCDQITAFCGSLPRPVERAPADAAERTSAEAGKKLFSSAGCAACHTPDLGPVQGVYSDLLLHRMGRDLTGDGDYNEPPRQRQQEEKEDDPKQASPLPDEWRTPPLWGVADSAPYLHDGRAATLEDAINEHGGQATSSRNKFKALPADKQKQLVAFLRTLRAPAQKP
jgi:CxxC motif-containing protein (DUF1111 family)